MKLAITTLLALAAALPAARAADVGVSVSISQPGAYGRIDIGRFPQPQVVLPQPVIITRPVAVAPAPPQPVYLWVPPGHRKDWRRHCGRYQACGMPVYFVRDDWYEGHVEKRHKWHDKSRHHHHHHHHHHHPKGKGGPDHDHGRGHGKDRD